MMGAGEMGSSADENRKHPWDAVIRELVTKGEVSEDVLYDSDAIIRWWRSLDPTKQEEITSRVEELSQGIFAEVPKEKTRLEAPSEARGEQGPKKRKKGCLGCLGMVAAFIIIVVVINLSSAENPRYIYQDGAIHVGADGKPIELINNPDATNPTYAELVAFIKEDTSDSKFYSEGLEQQGEIILARVCADFTEDVHNNAEANGIRAAWVGIAFTGGGDGHAINAFEATDRGLVYVDCTGASLGERLRQILKESSSQTTSRKPTSRDKVAYVEIGKEYGCISIDKAKSPSYSFYDECKQKRQERDGLLSEYDEEVIRCNREIETWKVRLDGSEQMIDRVAKEYEMMLGDFNNEVAQYKQEIAHRVYQEGSSELAALMAWKLRLEEKNQTIDKAYQEYERLLGDYNNEVAKYNQGHQVWEARLEQKKQVIEELAKELGDFWFKPLGIVEKIYIYWGGEERSLK
ncbi:MAG TPA: hypothetical protein VMW00_04295 [Dehalococcoidales bacterium]|nr:hypothetical protein [Dehalococcoidales bacterium]